MGRLLSGTAHMYAMDHERIGRNEHGERVIPVHILLTDIGVANKAQVPSLRVGGEVRLELDLFASIHDSNGMILINGEARLYEGDSDTTTDLEDAKQFKLEIPRKKQVTHTIDLYNSGDLGGGGDIGRISLYLTNTLVEED